MRGVIELVFKIND